MDVIILSSTINSSLKIKRFFVTYELLDQLNPNFKNIYYIIVYPLHQNATHGIRTFFLDGQ